MTAPPQCLGGLAVLSLQAVSVQPTQTTAKTLSLSDVAIIVQSD
jgi:hypothetical protein